MSLPAEEVGERHPLDAFTDRRKPIAIGVVAALLTIVMLLVAPAGPDVAAHVFQRAYFLKHGFSLWNNYWYAGQYDFVTYSLLYYPLAALLGVNVLSVISVGVASTCFALLVDTKWGRSALPSSISFACIWPGVVLSGALPFALGVACALAGAVCLLQRRNRWFAVAVVLTVAASPLAFMFLILPLAGLVVARRARFRAVALPAAIVAVVLGGELVLWRAFPSTGRYPFWVEDFLGAVVAAFVGALICWKTDRLRFLRWAFVLYGAACAVLFVVPTEIGANIARLRLMALPLALLLIGVRRWRPVLGCLSVIIAGAIWNLTALTTAYARASTDTSAQASYWAPAATWLTTHLAPGDRVEAVDTTGHWPAAYLPKAGIPLARGWFRQADFPGNELLYHPMTGPQYLAWLRSMAVKYVVMSDAAPDFSAVQEAELIQSGSSGLEQVATLSHIEIFAVPDPTALVTGPGHPTVVEFQPKGLVLAVDQPGTYRVAVRWSPYWRASMGCLGPADDGMTLLTVDGPGRVDIDLAVTPLEAFRVIAGRTRVLCVGATDSGSALP